MEIYKKFLIAIVIIIFTYITWRFIVRRQELIRQVEKFQILEGFIEGADPSAFELQSVHSTKPVKIQNVIDKYTNLPLIEFCIKGSYNSAFTGTYINTNMIKYLASRGCRFYDFEVFYINDKKKGKLTPQVGVSTDPTIKVLSSANSVLLDDVLSSVVANSFSQTSPNSGDPVFINLRIKLTDYTNQAAYQAIASSIDNILKNNLHKGKVTNQTPLKDIMGQIVLLVDKTLFYDYANYAKCYSATNCYDLTKYINMESGSETLNIIPFKDLTNVTSTPIMIKDDNLHTDISKMRLIYPNTMTKTNPIIYDNINKYNCQISPFKFYLLDSRLNNYEDFFDENFAAFVSLATAKQYYAKNGV